MRKIAPSMMCVNFDKIQEYIDVFEKENIEYLHIDIMDGEFVPNFTLGVDYVKRLRKLTKIPLDVHLMIKNPENKIEWFDFQEGEYVSIHAESTKHLHRALQKIHATGAKAMVAINPGTPINILDYVLDDIEGVLVMTVNPGFAGQKAIPKAIEKIADVRKYLDNKGYSSIEIEVDGNVSFDLAGMIAENHADIFVGGTSSFFSGKMDLQEGIQKLRAVINKTAS